MKRILQSLTVSFLVFGCKKHSENASPTPTPASRIDTVTRAIVINANLAQQTIYGFGGADIIDWTGDLTASQRDTAFSPTHGIGLSIVRVRVPVDSSEFTQAKTTIDVCKSYGGLAVASVWSAPAYMKTNGSTISGTIKPDSYAEFASYLKNFNTAVGGLAAVSPANEPNIKVAYESMEMTSSQVADFVAAQGDSCGAPIMAPEPFNMDETFINTFLSNPGANSKTTYIAGHIYGATPYDLSADKPVWMTEHYINSNISGNDWTNAMDVGIEINNCMSAGWGAYIWWYIRRSYGPMSESGNIQKLGYIMAQYARYIRPGYTKISCSQDTSAGIYATAYKSGSKLVVVVINQNSFGIYLPFNLSGAQVSGFNCYTTTSSSNLEGGNIMIQGSIFGAAFPPKSITTLVSG